MASWSARRLGVKAVLAFAAWLLVIASGPAQGGEQMFKGQITRCMCAALAPRAAASDKGEPIAACSMRCCVDSS